jgi:hypothetical protein
MEVPYFEPLKLELYHKLTLLMDSIHKGRMQFVNKTLPCPHNLPSYFKTWTRNMSLDHSMINIRAPIFVLRRFTSS